MIFRYKAKFISDIEQKIRKLLVNIAVAPFVGVWIEILMNRIALVVLRSRSLRGSVDWNTKKLMSPDDKGVAPFVGVWIEM